MRHLMPVLEILGAIAIGIVTYLVRKDATDALLIGFVVLFAVELLRTRMAIERISKQYHSLLSWFRSIAPVDDFAEIALLYGLKGFDHVSGNTIYVPRSDILPFWKNCISRTQNHWKVISYAAHDDTWGLGWMKYGNAIQKERLLSGCKITRVFLLDSLKEKALFENTMIEQSNIDIDVSWVLKEQLIQNQMVTEAFETLKTFDVAVVDNSWVYMTNLDKGRRLTGAQATRDKTMLKNAILIVDEAIEMAKLNKIIEKNA